MADYELRFRKRPGPLSRMLGTIGESALLQSLGDQELDEAEPKVVWHTDRSAALRALAFELVDAGTDDGDAVGELARTAGRHAKELRRAAATIRAEGLAGEDEAACRADRLLVAAASGRGVEPVSSEEAAWFAQVRSLAELPTAEGFAVLTVQEPELIGLADQVLSASGTSGPGDDTDGTDHAVPADLVDSGLDAVVGRTSSRLVRTRTARRILGDHLLAVAGAHPADTVAPASDDGTPPAGGVPGSR
jgi:hypothetical protein